MDLLTDGGVPLGLGTDARNVSVDAVLSVFVVGELAVVEQEATAWGDPSFRDVEEKKAEMI